MSLDFKVKKNLALALAALLVAAILTGVAALVLGISKAAGGNNMERIDFEKSFTAEEAREIESLSFENQEGKMNIVDGDGFRVEAKDVPESFVAKIEKGTFVVAYAEGNKWFSAGFGWNSFKDAEITITIPRDFAAGEAELSNGSGSMEIASLEADKISLSNGSGKVAFSNWSTGQIEIDNGSGRLEGTGLASGDLELSSGSGPVLLKQMEAAEVEIDGGSGIVSLDGAELKGLRFSGGSGAFELSGRIDGNLELDSGSGNVSITLENAREEYSISADIGSGGLWLDGERFKDIRKENPGAAYTIELDSGSGRVAIGFSEED